MANKRTTRTTTRTRRPGENASFPASDVSTNKETVPIDAKTSATTKHGTKRKAGQALKNGPQLKRAKVEVCHLITMPLDIAYEIFSYLSVEDMLSLSQIRNRSLYTTLTDPSSWKTVRANAVPPIPDCPEAMNVVSFVTLLFSNICQYCHETVLEKDINRAWYARRVICTDCVEKCCSAVHVATPFYLRKLFARKGNGWSKSTVYFDDYMPTVTIMYQSKSSSRIDYTYYFTEYYKIWEAKALKMETVDERWQWLEKKQTLHDAQTFTRLCNLWHKGHLIHQKAEHARRVNIQKARVVEYAKSIGWFEEIYKIIASEVGIQDLPEVVEACQLDLTQSSLSGLKPLIDAHMQIVKDNRLYRERKELLGRRLPVLRRAFSTYESQFSFSQRQSFISTAELFLEPPIQDLIFNFPDDVILTEAHILPTLTNIVPGANRRLRLQIEEQLFQIVQKAYRKRGDDSTIDRTVLNLATTVFNCRDCDQQPFLSVEEAIMHLCTRNRYFPEGYRDKSSIRSHLGNQFRSHQSLTVHVKGADGVTQLIKVCGLDPLTTTKQTMDELNPIFECIKCYLYSLEGRSMGSWATMANHYAQQHCPSYYRGVVDPFEPERLIGEEAIVVRARMAEQRARTWNQYKPCKLACAHCGKSDCSDRRSLEGHIKATHGRVVLAADDFIPNPSEVHTPIIYYLWPPRSDHTNTVVVTFEK